MRKGDVKIKIYFSCIGFLAAVFLFVSSVSIIRASETDGVILAPSINDGFAWSDKIGWINFKAANGNVSISDGGITGYVWSSNNGWINMSPSNGGVEIDSNGNLSGYAWGSNTGWINFSGVSINSSGRFLGEATGANVGTVNFSCTNCNVMTDFRPRNSRTITRIPSDVGSGGVFGGSAPVENIIAPIGGFNFLINDGVVSTDSANTILTLIGNGNTDLVWISNDADLSGVSQVKYDNNASSIAVPWYLPGEFGKKTIYAKFCTQWGSCSATISHSIDYTEAVPPSASIPAVVPVAPEVSPAPQTASIRASAIPTIGTEEGQPPQLFDIRLILESNAVSKVGALVARVMFTSFGRAPTPIDMQFTILNADGKEIWDSSDTTTVQTEAVFIKRFFEAGDLSSGKYKLRLKTLYNRNVEDIFYADFEIKKAKVISYYWVSISLLVVVVIGIALLIIKKRKEEKIKKMAI